MKKSLLELNYSRRLINYTPELIVMKHRKRERRKKQLKILLILFGIALVAAILTIIHDYKVRPGMLEKVWITDRGGDYITVAWEKPRNVYRYIVKYDGKTKKVSGKYDKVKITGLEPDTRYDFSVRADSRLRKGFESKTASARTKKAQTIQGETNLMRFANRPVDLNQTAETPITYTSEDGSIDIKGDKIIFTRSGKIRTTAKTEETAEYASASKEITVEVLDSVNVDANGATPHIMYKLNKSNCENVRSIKGTTEATTPQSFAYGNGKYVICYVSGKTQRIVTYGNKRTEYKPKQDLEHANGLTFVDGYCYSVRGGISTKCVTFTPENKDYGWFDLPHDASGIAYDAKKDMFFTTSRRGMTSYDGNFNILKRIGTVKRTETNYVQDCGAYGGIMMHCVSGKTTKGTNYIDFYDMIEGKYLGSAECQLGEIESLLVNDEGYVELLCNVKGTKDYIMRTPINMKMLCD